MRWFFPMILAAAWGYAAGLEWLQGEKLLVTHADGNRYVVTRYLPPECRGIAVMPESVWEREKVPAACVEPLVKTLGTLSMMHAGDGVETYGELEVLAFIKAMRPDGRKVFVDTRSEEWYAKETIPGARNIWYKTMLNTELYAEEFQAVLKQLRVAKNPDGTLDFSRAPELLLFCNGPWCTQSPNAIKALLRLGYPAGKLKWYRGGMHDWKSLAMTTTAVQPR